MSNEFWPKHQMTFVGFRHFQRKPARLTARKVQLGLESCRAHLFNQLLIALSIFDILFIVCSVPVYSFPLFEWLEGSKVRKAKGGQDTKE